MFCEKQGTACVKYMLNLLPILRAHMIIAFMLIKKRLMQQKVSYYRVLID